VEGSGRGLTEGISRILTGGTEEIHEEPQDSRSPGRDFNSGPN
jgi:hypothetical protein